MQGKRALHGFPITIANIRQRLHCSQAEGNSDPLLLLAGSYENRRTIVTAKFSLQKYRGRTEIWVWFFVIVSDLAERW